MDFESALYFNGTLTAVLLFVSLLVYSRQVKKVLPDVTKNTGRALMLLGFTGLMMIAITLVGMYLRIFVTGWVALFYGSMAIAQIQIVYSEESKIKRWSALVIVLTVITFIDSIFREFMSMPIYIMAIGLTILMVANFVYIGLLLKDTFSPFTVSLFLLILSYTISGAAAVFEIHQNPEFFSVLTVPFIMAAAIFVSLNRPWRYIITSFIGLYTIIQGSSLIVLSFLSNEAMIYIYVIAASFAALCLLFPLNYFLEQTITSKAKTPKYLAGVLVFIGLLVTTHSLSWSIAMDAGGLWNQYLVWFDFVIGMVAISLFTLSGIAANFGDTIINTSRDALTSFSSVIIVLAFPAVIDGRYETQLLYLPILLVILVPVLLIFKVAARLVRIGAKGAATGFVTFVFASLFVGIVAMYSDNFPLFMNFVLLTSSGLLLLASSPQTVTAIRQRIRREPSEVKQDSRQA